MVYTEVKMPSRVGARMPAKREERDLNATIRELRAENRRLRKLLKESKRYPPEIEEEDSNDELSWQSAPQPYKSPIPLTCPCSKNQNNIKKVDLNLYTMYFCLECNSRKAIKK